MGLLKRLDVKISIVVVVAMFVSSSYAIWLYSKQFLILMDQLSSQQRTAANSINNQFLALEKTFNKQQLIKKFHEFTGQPVVNSEHYYSVLLDSRFTVLASSLPNSYTVELVRTDVAPKNFVVTLSSNTEGADLVYMLQAVPGQVITHPESHYLIVTVPISQLLTGSLPINTVWQQFTQHIDAFAVLFVIMGFIAIVIIIRNLAPLKRLRLMTLQLANNQIPEQVPEVGKSEIGQLVTAFNQASKKLANYQRQREQMTSDIAHELRTPITNMQGRIEAYDEGIISDEKHVIEFVSGQLKGLANIVEDMQLLSTGDANAIALQCAPLNLKEYFQQWIRQYCVQDDVAFKLDIDDLVWQLDGNRMSQVFDNLLANAKSAQPLDLNISISAKLSNDNLVITFADNGPGVESSHLPLLFDRLYRVDSSRSESSGGSGLGLSIVKTLVEAQQGRVEASPSKSGGLTISMVFS